MDRVHCGLQPGDDVVARPPHRHVDEHLWGLHDEFSGPRAQRAVPAAGGIERLHAGEQPVTGGGQVGEDQMPRLLAAEHPPTVVERLEHVPVANRSLVHGDAVSGQCPTQAQVGHHGDDHRAVGQQPPLVTVHGADGQQVVAVEQCAVGGHRHDPVAVAVESEAGVSAPVDHLALQGFGLGGATAFVDVAPVGFGVDDRHLRAQPLDDLRSPTRHGAVRAVQDHPQTRQGSGADRSDHGVGPTGVDHLVGGPGSEGFEGWKAVPAPFDGHLGGVVQLASAGTEHLDAVVRPRVVGGRHDGTGDAVQGRQMGDSRRGDHTEACDGDPRLQEALGQRPFEGRTGHTGVASNDDPVGAQVFTGRPPEGAHHRLGELGVSPAPDTVGAKAQSRIRHGVSCGVEIVGARPPAISACCTAEPCGPS